MVGRLQGLSEFENLSRSIGTLEEAAEASTIVVLADQSGRPQGLTNALGECELLYRCAATSSSESEFEASVSPSHTDCSSSVRPAVSDDTEEDDPTAQSLSSLAALVSRSFNDV